VAHNEDQFLHSFSELASLLISEETIDSTLSRIGDLAVLGIHGCDAASVSIVEDQRVTSVAFSGPLAREGDDGQYAAGEGPCLTAIAERRTITLESFPNEARWPRFRDRVAELGIGSMLSIPLVIDGRVGALNLYSRMVGGFPDPDRSLAALFAAQAAVALANAEVHEHDTTLAKQLEEALTSRATIDQAKGILMEREGCDADEAFTILRRRSQRLNRKLRDVANEIVQSPRRRPVRRQR